jgi:thiamine-phosphate pyrophosphorylase
VLPAFYPILDVDVARARLLDPLAVLDGWLDAGVRLVQLRAKALAGAAFLELANRCAQRAASAGATFIVNDRADVALLSRAGGVHLGQEDLPPVAARRVVPSPTLIGWSTHNEAQVQAASSMPIDYLAIGPVFGTTSKERPDAVVGIEGVRMAVRLAAGRPVVAIGGITIDTASEVLRAGASSIAVISDVMHADAATRAREFLQVTG